MPPRPVVPHARFRKPPAYRKVHMLWLQAAALLPGRTLHTALALWMAACDTRNPTVLFNPKTALRFGVSREAAQDAISRLLAFGLVALPLAIADRHGISMKAAGLQFALANPAVAAVIPGASKPDRIAEDRAALNEVVPADFWRELRRAGLVHRDAPLPE